MHIAIAGNIGSGKTTIVKRAKEDPSFKVFEEDFESWSLSAFYKALTKNDQKQILRTQFKIAKSLNSRFSELSDTRINLFERDLVDSQLFASILKEDKTFTDETFSKVSNKIQYILQIKK